MAPRCHNAVQHSGGQARYHQVLATTESSAFSDVCSALSLLNLYYWQFFRVYLLSTWTYRIVFSAAVTYFQRMVLLVAGSLISTQKATYVNRCHDVGATLGHAAQKDELPLSSHFQALAALSNMTFPTRVCGDRTFNAIGYGGRGLSVSYSGKVGTDEERLKVQNKILCLCGGL